jgi:DnaJ-class molecular chaperone
LAQDPYRELGVSRSASADDIRKAFRKLAKQHHPDANPGDKASEEKFKRLSAAFDLLGDPDKRKKFDAGEIDADGRETMRGFTGNPFGQGAPFGQGHPFGQGPGPGARGAEFENFDFSDIIGDIFGGGGRRGGFASRGTNVRAKVEIDLEEAVKGGKRRIAFGDGRVLEVTIPVGAADGQVLRLKGQGSPGRAGAGDALIEIAIRPHPRFRREGGNLAMDVPISVPDAVLGGKVQAPTPDGPVTLNVPKGSNSGSVLRLRRRGLADAQGHRGDLLARLVVTLPDDVDARLEDFAEEWRRERPYSPKQRT